MSTGNNNGLGMIPVLTTSSGACLTAANWQEVGIKAVSYHLASLLLKPGYDFLKTLTDLEAYIGWQKTVVLNASLPKVNKEGLYTLRSPFDGSIVHHTLNDIITLISKLQPQFAILPQGVSQQNPQAWLSIPESVFPFFPVTDLPQHDRERPYGVYFCHDETTPLATLLQQLAQYKHLPIYVSGDLNFSQMGQLIDAGVDYIESDLPAMEACHGNVYSDDGIIRLSNADQALQFELIDANCQCPTCKQQFTRAYLHHLLLQTPLLCQRFLIQHNVYFVQTKFLDCQ